MNGFYIKIVTSLSSLKFYSTFHAQIIIQKYLHNALVALVQTLLTSKRLSKISNNDQRFLRQNNNTFNTFNNSFNYYHSYKPLHVSIIQNARRS